LVESGPLNNRYDKGEWVEAISEIISPEGMNELFGYNISIAINHNQIPTERTKTRESFNEVLQHGVKNLSNHSPRSSLGTLPSFSFLAVVFLKIAVMVACSL